MNPINKTAYAPYRTAGVASAPAAIPAPPPLPSAQPAAHKATKPKAKGTAAFQLARRDRVKKTPEDRVKDMLTKNISALIAGDAIVVATCQKVMSNTWEEARRIYMNKHSEQPAEGRNTLIRLYNEVLAEQGFQNPFFMQRENGCIFSNNGSKNGGALPLVMKRGVIPHDLQIVAGKISEGANGYVSILQNPEGKQFIAKFDKHPDRLDEMKQECEAYAQMYERAGPHRNIVNVYGLTNIADKPALLMEMIPGHDGDKTFLALYDNWQAGHISSAEYWSAIQFIGRRLFEATKHLEKAGVLHNDIKPANFRFDLGAGEPKLIDLGRWCKTGDSRTGTPGYQSPEAEQRKPLDRRSDDYTVGTTMMAGVEGRFGRNGKSRQLVDGRWQWVPNEKAEKETILAYAEFLKKITSTIPEMREEIEKSAFLADSILDDNAAKEVIKNVLTDSTAWHKARPARVDKYKNFVNKNNATLGDYLDLVRTAKVDPLFASRLNFPGCQQKLKDVVSEELKSILLMPRNSEEFKQRARMFLLNMHRISKLQRELNVTRADAIPITTRNRTTFPVSAYFAELAQAIGTNLDGTPIETDPRKRGRTDARLDSLFSPPDPQTMNAVRKLAADIWDQKAGESLQDNIEVISQRAANLIPASAFQQWKNYEEKLRNWLQSGKVHEGSRDYLSLEADIGDITEVLNVLRRQQRQEALKELFANGAFPAARLRANIQNPRDA